MDACQGAYLLRSSRHYLTKTMSRLCGRDGGEFLNLAYPRPILSKFYSILSLLTYCELKLVPLQSGYDVTHLSSDRCYTPKIYI